MSYSDDLLRFDPWPYKPGGIPDPCRAKFYREAIGAYADACDQLELLEEAEEKAAERDEAVDERDKIALAAEDAQAELTKLASNMEDDAYAEGNAEELRNQIGQAVAKIEAIAEALGEALK